MRKKAWITAAVAAAALLVGGCSSGSDDDGDAENPTSAPSNGGGEQDNQGGGSVDGVWRSGDGADMQVLNIEGTEANLISGGTACSGSLSDEGDSKSVSLTCPDGSTERTKGVLTLGEDQKSLTIAWEGASEETYTKTEIPTDLPDPGNLPTDLPSMPEMPDAPDIEMPEMPEMPG